MRDALYERLTAEERLNLTIEALARGDIAEADRLADTCPEYVYRLPDTLYSLRFRDLLHLATLVSAWAWRSAYRVLCAKAAINILERNRSIDDTRLDEALEAIEQRTAELKGIYAAWERFCGHIGIDAQQVLRLCGFPITDEPWVTAAGVRGERIAPNHEEMERIFEVLMDTWGLEDPKDNERDHPIIGSGQASVPHPSRKCRVSTKGTGETLGVTTKLLTEKA